MAKLRDRRKGFFWADNDLIERHGAALGPYGIAVYVALAKIAGDQSVTSVSVKTIAEKLGIGTTKTRQSLQKLEELGWIAIKHRTTQTQDGKARNLASEYVLLEAPPPSPGEGGYSATRSRVPRHTEEGTPPGVDIKEPFKKESSGKEPPEKEDSGAEAPAPSDNGQMASEKKRVTHNHPAIQAYREAAHVYPHKEWYEDVASIVGEDPERVARFQAHVKDCVGKGWRPTNVKAMLETFQKVLPTTRPTNGGRATVRRVESHPPAEDPPDASEAAIQVWQTTYTELQLQMPRETFDAWLRRSRLLRVAEENGTQMFHVGVQNQQAQEWLEHRLKKVVVRALTSVARQPVDVSFEVLSRKGEQHDSPDTSRAHPPQPLAAPAAGKHGESRAAGREPPGERRPAAHRAERSAAGPAGARGRPGGGAPG